jgi:DNA replication and repair protein RecF
LRQNAPAALRHAFDEPLARVGAKIRLRREQLLDELRGHAALAFAEVARGEAPLKLTYLAAGRESDGLGADAALEGEEKLAEKFFAALERRSPRDLERGYTSIGPHADDLALSIGDRPARLFASQGQARAGRSPMESARSRTCAACRAGRRSCCSTTSPASSTPSATPS